MNQQDNESKKTTLESLKELWQDGKYWIIGVPAVIILIFVSGGIFRVATGGEFIPKNTETAEQRESRLYRCAEVYNTTPTHSQQIDGDDRGVCKGFTEQEIEVVKQKVEQ
jgi:hypothetical protein